jgi:transcriptional regulator with XRE-family HTH domain
MDEPKHPLRKWRHKNRKERTLAAVADQVGVVPSYISEVERFKKQPSMTVAARLSNLAGIPLNKFLKPASVE